MNVPAGGEASTTAVTTTPEHNSEVIRITDAALVKVINQYCGHEAGVRNLRKCLDRIFRKIVAKMEDKKLISSGEGGASTTIDVTSTTQEVKEYQVNT